MQIAISWGDLTCHYHSPRSHSVFGAGLNPTFDTPIANSVPTLMKSREETFRLPKKVSRILFFSAVESDLCHILFRRNIFIPSRHFRQLCCLLKIEVAAPLGRYNPIHNFPHLSRLSETHYPFYWSFLRDWGMTRAFQPLQKFYGEKAKKNSSVSSWLKLW